jgi:hypothetical protein
MYYSLRIIRFSCHIESQQQEEAYIALPNVSAHTFSHFSRAKKISEPSIYRDGHTMEVYQLSTFYLGRKYEGLSFKTPYAIILRCILHSYIMGEELVVDEQSISHTYYGVIRRFLSSYVNPHTVASSETSLDTFSGNLPHYPDCACVAHHPYPWGYFGR